MAIHGRGFPIRPHLVGPIVTRGLGPGGGSVGPVTTVASTSSSALTIPMTLYGVYVITWVQTDSAITTPSIGTDSLGNIWALTVSTNVVFRAGIFTTTCLFPGSSTVTVSLSPSAAAFKWQYYEILPSQPSNVLTVGTTTGTNEDAALTSHFCAAGTGYNTKENSVIIGCSSASASAGAFTASAGYTKQSGAATDYFSCSGFSAPALTNERVPFSSSSSINCKACTAFVWERLGDGYLFAASGNGSHLTGRHVHGGGVQRVIGF